ncbi:MAG: hypothetical protein ACR2OZ_17330 [Verrucomicrobiales bacterium]
MKVDFYICPTCGAEVRVGSKTCAKCASDRATKRWDAVEDQPAWEQNGIYDGLDLPEDEFDYRKFVDEEFGGGPRRPIKYWLWWAVALLTLLAAVCFFILGGMLR